MAPVVVPGPNGTKAVPQLPPPGGTALMLPPTNNPKLPVKAAASVASSSLTRPSSPQPVSRMVPAQQQPAVSQPIPAIATTASAAPTPPPGTEVTPLEGMQQMGLAPDPSPDGDSTASGNPTGLTAGQDLQQPTSTDAVPEAAPVQVAPEAAPAADQFRSSQPISLLPLAGKADGGSYAVIGPAPKTSATTQKVQAAAKNKTVAVPKVHLASETTTVTPAPSAKTAAATPAASTPAAAAGKSSNPPVQLLEGHLTQEPDSSSTTASNPKQPK